MKRRDLLKLSVAIGGSLLVSKNVTAYDINTKNQNGVIYIFLSGGISHIDMTHPVTELSEYRSVMGATNGYLPMGGSFVEMSKSNKFVIVKSFSGRDANHQSAQIENLTSVPNQNPSQIEPSYGSVVSQYYGSIYEDMPTYCKLNKIEGDKSGWLGVKNNGFERNDEGIRNLTMQIPVDRFDKRMEVLRGIDRAKNLGQMGESWSQLKDQSVRIMQGKAAKCFDISKDVNPYGSGLGESFLIARKCREAGAKFITINSGGWDNHDGIETSFETRGRELDSLISKLVLDLEERGLLSTTLVVITSEFGRTPKLVVNPGSVTAGRNHWPGLCSLVFAGGNQSGRIIGECNDKAEVPVSNTFTVKDLAKTVYNFMGINDLTLTDHSGRPRYMLDPSASNILTT